MKEFERVACRNIFIDGWVELKSCMTHLHNSKTACDLHYTEIEMESIPNSTIYIYIGE